MRATLAAAVFLAACGADPELRAAVPERGARAPAEWTAAASDRLVLAWIIHERSLMSCVNAAHDLRHALGRSGSRLDVRVVAVTDDPGLIRSFLASERLQHLPTTSYTEEEFRSSFGFVPTSSVFLVRGSTVVDRIPVGRDSLLAGGGTGRLDASIREQLDSFPVPEAPVRSQ